MSYTSFFSTWRVESIRVNSEQFSIKNLKYLFNMGILSFLLTVSIFSNFQLIAYSQTSDAKVEQAQSQSQTQIQNQVQNQIQTNQSKKDSKNSKVNSTKDSFDKPEIQGSCLDPLGWIEDESARTNGSKTYFVPRNKSVSTSARPTKEPSLFVKTICAFAGKVHFKDNFDNNKFKDIDNQITEVDKVSDSKNDKTKEQAAKTKQKQEKLSDKVITKDKELQEGYIYTNISNDFKVYFNTDPNKGWIYYNSGNDINSDSDDILIKTVKVTVGDNKILKSKQKPILEGNKITYPEVLPSIDLQYIVSNTGVNKYFVLKDKKALKSDLSRIDYTTQTNQKIETKDNISTITSGTNKIVMEKAYTFDSEVNSDIKEEKLEIKTEAKANNTNYNSNIITIFTDKNYLEDDKRKFPIVIDPGYSSGVYGDSYVTSAYPNNAQGGRHHLAVGGSTDISCTAVYGCPASYRVTRTLLKFPNIPDVALSSVSQWPQLVLNKYGQNGNDFSVTAFNRGDCDFNDSQVTWNSSGCNNLENIGSANVNRSRNNVDIGLQTEWLKSRANKNIIIEVRASNESVASGAVFCSDNINYSDGYYCSQGANNRRPVLSFTYDTWQNYQPRTPNTDSPVSNGDYRANCQMPNCNFLFNAAYTISNINDGNNGDRDAPKLYIDRRDFINDVGYQLFIGNVANNQTYTHSADTFSGVFGYQAVVEDRYGSWSNKANSMEDRLHILDASGPVLASPYSTNAANLDFTNRINTLIRNSGSNNTLPVNSSNNSPIWVGRDPKNPSNSTPQVSLATPNFSDNLYDRIIITPATNSNKAIDINNSELRNGNNIQIWDKNQSFNSQQWLVESNQIRLGNSGYCLDSSGGLASGSRIHLWSCHGGTNQKFVYEPLTQEIKALDNQNLCLDRANNAFDNGTILQLFNCNKGSAQKWSMEKLEIVRVIAGGKSIDFNPDLAWSNSYIWDSNAGTYQMFFYNTKTQELRTRNNNCLDARNSSHADRVWLGSCHGGTNQKWEFRNDGNVSPVSNMSVCLDVNGGNFGNGTGIFLHSTCNGSTNASQRFSKENFWKYRFAGLNMTYQGRMSSDSNFINARDGLWQSSGNFNYVLDNTVATSTNNPIYYLQSRARDRNDGGSISTWSNTVAIKPDFVNPLINNTVVTYNYNWPNIDFEALDSNLAMVEVELGRSNNGSYQPLTTINNCNTNNEKTSTGGVVLTPCIFTNKNWQENDVTPKKIKFLIDPRTQINGQTLEEGQYRVKIKAYDRAGNLSEREELIRLDFSGANINISYPQNQTWTNQDQITITGGIAGYNYNPITGNSGTLQNKDIKELIVTKLNGIETGSRKIDINSNYNFQYQTKLNLGNNQFSMETTDLAGNKINKIGDNQNSLTNNGQGLQSIWNINVEKNAPSIVGIYPNNKRNSNFYSLQNPLVLNNPTTKLNFTLRDSDVNNANISGLHFGSNPKGIDLTLIRSFNGTSDWKEIPLYKDGTNISDPNPSPRLASDLNCTPLISPTSSEIYCDLTLSNLQLDGFYSLIITAHDRAGNSVTNSTKNNQSNWNLQSPFRIKTTSYHKITSLTTLDGISLNNVSQDSNTAFTTSSNRVTLTGSIEKGSTITIKRNNIDFVILSPASLVCSNQRLNHDNNLDTPDIEICNYQAILNLESDINTTVAKLNTLEVASRLDTLINPPVVIKATMSLHGFNLNTNPSVRLISPNNDGIFDTVTFNNSINLNNGSLDPKVNSYVLEVKNASNHVVWLTRQSAVTGQTFSLPKNIVWNGNDIFLSRPVADGSYTYNLSIVTTAGIAQTTNGGAINVKTRVSSNEKIVLNNPIDNFTTSRGSINVQGLAQSSSDTSNWTVKVCADIISTTINSTSLINQNISNKNCVASATIKPSGTGQFALILNLPYPDLDYKVYATALDNAQNLVPSSSSTGSIVKFTTPSSIRSLEVSSSLNGLNTKDEMNCLFTIPTPANCSTTNLDNSKSLKITAKVAKGTEGLEIDFADNTNLNQLPNTIVANGLPAEFNRSNRIAILNNRVQTNLRLNPSNNFNIKENLFQKTINSEGGVIMTGNDLAKKANLNACDLEECIWTFYYHYPYYFGGGKYEIRARSFKGEDVQEATRSFEVNGQIKTNPTLLKADKHALTNKCLYLNTQNNNTNCSEREYSTIANSSILLKDITLADKPQYPNQDLLSNIYTNTDTRFTIGSDPNVDLGYQIFTNNNIIPTVPTKITPFIALKSDNNGFSQININTNSLTDNTYIIYVGLRNKDVNGNLTDNFIDSSISKYNLILDRNAPKLTSVITNNLTNGRAINPWLRSGDRISFNIETNEPAQTSLITESGFRSLGEKAKVQNTLINQLNSLNQNVQVSTPCPTSDLDLINNNGVAGNPILSSCRNPYLERLNSTTAINIVRDNEGMYYSSILLTDLAGNSSLISNDNVSSKHISNAFSRMLVNQNGNINYDFDPLAYTKLTLETNNNTLNTTNVYSAVPRSRSLDFRLLIDNTAPNRSEFDLTGFGDGVDGIRADGVLPEKDRISASSNALKLVTRNNNLSIKGKAEKNQRAELYYVTKNNKNNQQTNKFINPSLSSNCFKNQYLSADKIATTNNITSIITQFKDNCDFNFTFDFTTLGTQESGVGQSPNGDPLTSIALQYRIIDLAGNANSSEMDEARNNLRPANANCPSPLNIPNQSTWSCQVTIFYDKEAPLNLEESKSRNILENRSQQTGYLIGSGVVDLKEIATNKNPIDYAPATNNQLSVTKEFDLEATSVGESQADTVTTIANPKNTISTTQSKVDSNFNSKTRINLGNTRDDLRPATDNCITTSQTPIKNRRIGTCQDGIYTIKQNFTDTAGNTSKEWIERIERDTVAPGTPVINLTKTGDIVRETGELTIVGEQNTVATINISGSNNFSDTRIIPLNSGEFNDLDFLGKLACGGITYTVKVTLKDKVGNVSSEGVATIRSEVCPSCGSNTMISPIKDPKAYIGYVFGISNKYFDGKRFHYGVDYNGVPKGTNVYSAFNGTVVRMRKDITQENTMFGNGSDERNNGNWVEVDHGNGLTTLYGHLNYNSINVTLNQQINTNTVIGTMGSTGFSSGPHLHFEVRLNGIAQDPVPYLSGKGATANTGNLNTDQRKRFNCRDVRGGSTGEEFLRNQVLTEEQLRQINKEYVSSDLNKEFIVSANWDVSGDDIRSGVDRINRKIKFDIVSSGVNNPSDMTTHDGKTNIWIVSHGWNRDPKSVNPIDWENYMAETARLITQNYPGDIVLLLDWREAAGSGKDTNPNEVFRAARWIRPVVREAAKKLRSWGVNDGSKLNFVGHSLGTFISTEMAREMGGSNNAILLDPPSQLSTNCRYDLQLNLLSPNLMPIPFDLYFSCWGYDIDGNIDGNQIPGVNIDGNSYYKKQFRFSRSFVGAQSVAGNQLLTPTAHEAIRIKFEGIPLDFGDQHFAVISVFNRLNGNGSVNYRNKKQELQIASSTRIYNDYLTIKDLSGRFRNSWVGSGPLANSFNTEMYTQKKDTDYRDYIRFVVTKNNNEIDIFGTDKDNDLNNTNTEIQFLFNMNVNLYGGGGNDKFQLISDAVFAKIHDFSDSGDRIGLNDNITQSYWVTNKEIYSCRFRVGVCIISQKNARVVGGSRINEISDIAQINTSNSGNIFVKNN
jgi:Peptidase family M23/Ricin-type beta-trefoil lectin domain